LAGALLNIFLYIPLRTQEKNYFLWQNSKKLPFLLEAKAIN